MKIKPLSKLELEIMEIIWEYGECTIRDVVNKMSKTKTLAYTTIATIITRLIKKGTLKKQDEKFSATYVPTLSKEDMSKTVAQTFLTKFIRSFGDAAIASFAQSVDRLPKKKKEYFLKLLNVYEKENK
ncbi:hypothetical protein A3C23_01205 [Candidatus Roizmanbacteria bacterium RIFCSPHIGHO2_02_FULL_37_13b]|uniref:CopY family transcriptional regulator n=1 Tax=Candidatus Roizmanbacteria bacterium RIFCSPLOWO2_02_FULL_36_11 TaxID=1802071 RepID=A0A1F7JHF2_9BACT|nr:MAG: hypothetical protein A3C23_01205 [Candidatus Roizmanbacteria bacterium RIFCSPHIGHO2_02_FULL_37_13b]OGK55043.1 MAG: hypothetical protein A3H78_01030 [Candidatus Roizmanbacteria bacterium RIFCSPLOWO2_02_FULL_36_11]